MFASRKWGAVGLAVIALVAASLACSASAEVDYANAVTTQLDKLQTAIGDVSTLMDEASSDSSKVDDPEWKGKLKAAADIVQQSHQALVALTPPDSMKDVHAQLISATQDCSDGMAKIVDGTNTKDLDKVNDGATLLQSCGSKLQSLGDQLQKK